MPVQFGVCLQLVHILGESVLKLFKFYLVDSVSLAHQVETEPVFHRPCLADTVLQFFRRYEFLRVVSLHLDMNRFAQKYHYFRVEVADSDGGKG